MQTCTVVPVILLVFLGTLITPRHATPGHGTPGHASPGHATPGHALPGHGTPGHATPGHANKTTNKTVEHEQQNETVIVVPEDGDLHIILELVINQNNFFDISKNKTSVNFDYADSYNDDKPSLGLLDDELEVIDAIDNDLIADITSYEDYYHQKHDLNLLMSYLDTNYGVSPDYLENYYETNDNYMDEVPEDYSSDKITNDYSLDKNKQDNNKQNKDKQDKDKQDKDKQNKDKQDKDKQNKDKQDKDKQHKDKQDKNKQNINYESVQKPDLYYDQVADYGNGVYVSSPFGPEDKENSSYWLQNFNSNLTDPNNFTYHSKKEITTRKNVKLGAREGEKHHHHQHKKYSENKKSDEYAW